MGLIVCKYKILITWIIFSQISTVFWKLISEYILTLDISIDLKPVYVPYIIPYPYFTFQKQPVHVPYSVPWFFTEFFPYPYLYFIFKIIPVFRTISETKITFLLVYLTPSVPILWYGVRYVYGIRTRTPGYGTKVKIWKKWCHHIGSEGSHPASYHDIRKH